MDTQMTIKNPPILQVSCSDKDGNKYPDIFITSLEESLSFIKHDYNELEKVRQRLLQLNWIVSDTQARLRYPKKITEANKENKEVLP